MGRAPTPASAAPAQAWRAAAAAAKLPAKQIILHQENPLFSSETDTDAGWVAGHGQGHRLDESGYVADASYMDRRDSNVGYEPAQVGVANGQALVCLSCRSFLSLSYCFLFFFLLVPTISAAFASCRCTRHRYPTSR